ncbi:PREDICTED: uncharacterized protein LOC104811890 [Tarenaya hassleriana]|uniref:uncharacterized protein LOC104811890 n=1 Tax=Tarenaya hassleriana TaxID=28532 RepID=UPI00053C16C3|nr:PREDICTED: uncharacterized protein LOC104811890 [Tarenaya hassleriana]
MSSIVDAIPKLNGSNFEEWKERLLLELCLMDHDFVFFKDRPDIKDTMSSAEDLERWDRSNRICLMLMRYSIPRHLRGVVPADVASAKEFLQVLEKSFAVNKFAEESRLLKELTSMRYEGEGDNMWEYVGRMVTIAGKLKAVGSGLEDSVVVSLVLDSLPSQYCRLRASYRHSDEEWTVNELIRKCVHEYEGLKVDKVLCGKRKNESVDLGPTLKK